MKLIEADFILTCKDNFEIIQDGGVVFDKEIIEVGKANELREKYPNIECIKSPINSVLLPGLINPHVHLEFSSNSATLAYGDFITWLNSVITSRDDIITKSTDELIYETLQTMLQSGTTSLGAISSFGNDLDACKKTSQRVVFFSEVLGSRPESVDVMYQDFQSRLRHVEELEDEKLKPAISIHSPYSTHPILAKNVLNIAQKRGYRVSTHFMESVAEREWLDSAKGDFTNFFSNFAPNARPMSSADEYIELFRGCKTLFTHCVQATKDELEKIHSFGGFITHCPVSNRLLGVGKLELSKLSKKDNFTIGTDGLSSNFSLSLWDELRAFLMMHTSKPLSSLAKLGLLGVTKNSANALGLKTGVIQEEFLSDFIICSLPEIPSALEDLALQLILHVKNPESIYIAGEKL